MSAFIMEHPGLPVSDRKRHPHSIVSCDRCRQKRIKCVITPGRSVCEGCARHATADKGQCTFLDRERYLDARKNIILSELPDATMNKSSGGNTPDSPSNLEKSPSPITEPSDLSTFLIEKLADYGQRAVGIADLAPTPSDEELQPNLMSDFIHPELIPYFIEVFFFIHGRQTRFISYERTKNEYMNSALPVTLASLIALLAIPYCTGIEQLNGINFEGIAAQYVKQAQIHISAQWSNPSALMIRSLVLMSSFELSGGDVTAANAYLHRAYEMAAELNLGNQDIIARLSSDADEQQCLQELWTVVNSYGTA